MKVHKRILAVVATICLIFCGGCSKDADVSKSKNNDADVQKLEQDYKLVSTSVTICEIFEKLGIESEHIVGIPKTESKSIPDGYSRAKEVGMPMSPDMEILKSLSPDYVLSPCSLRNQLKPEYDRLGLKSYFIDLKSVEGLYDSIDKLGVMLGKEKEAAQLRKSFDDYIGDSNYQERKAEKPKVLILMGFPGSYAAATESSYVGDLVSLAGGVNVYGDGDGKEFLNVTAEDMLKTEPDIILRTSHALPNQVMKMFDEEFKENTIWRHFEAVKNNKVYNLDSSNFGMSADFRWEYALNDLKNIF